MNTPTDTPGTTNEGGSVMTTTVAEYSEYDEIGLPADKRCDRCGAQALVQVEMPFLGSDGLNVELLFCNHHASDKGKGEETHIDRLKMSAKAIFDYRPFMLKEEGKSRSIGSDHA